MKTKLAFLFLVLFVVCGHAQEYAFKVLVNKGKNEVKSANGWQSLKVGTSLKSLDELKVAENAYIGLVHTNGKPLEVKQAGKYKVGDLETKVKGGSSVLNKYTDFILSANTTRKNNLAATGAVHRGIKNVEVYLPETSQGQIIYGDVVIIRWDSEKIPGPYTVKFNSVFDDELDKVETKDNSLKIDLTSPTFVNEDNILVSVTPKSDPAKVSKKFTLRRLSKADKERIKNLLAEISDQVTEETALNKLLLAGFYEQNGLLIDASTAYLQAIALAPDVQEYKDAYNDFIIQNGLKEVKKDK